jgi:3-hydroxyisobutyrate dehydrogenase
MCGGTSEVFTKARRLLECIGSKIVHVGPVGAGQRTKAANQIAIALGIIAMTEALHFARTQGLDPKTTLDILQGGAAGSWTLSNYGPRLLKGDFAPGFDAAHMLKDVRIALREAADTCTLPGTEVAAELFEQLVTHLPGLGHHALIESYSSVSPLTDLMHEAKSQ